MESSLVFEAIIMCNFLKRSNTFWTGIDYLLLTLTQRFVKHFKVQKWKLIMILSAKYADLDFK